MSDMTLNRWLEDAMSRRGDVTSALLVVGAHGSPTRLMQWPAGHRGDQALLDAAHRWLADAAANEPRHAPPTAEPEAATGASPSAPPTGASPDEPAAQAAANGVILTRPVHRDGKVVGALAMRLNRRATDQPAPDAPVAPARASDEAQAPVAARQIDLASTVATPPPAPSSPVATIAPAAPAAPVAESTRDDVLRLMHAALATPRFDRCAAALATELAAAFECDRVFIGMSTGRHVKLEALSHGTLPSTQAQLLRHAGAAMDEALDQGASLQYPQHPQERPRIVLAHAELAAGRSLLTVPMFAEGLAIGALTLERAAGGSFDAATVARAEGIASALAPLLRLKHHQERSALQRLRASMRQRLAGLSRPQRRAALGVAALALVAITALLASPRTFEVSAPTRLEGRVQRALAAPVDGFLKSVQVRPGDTVRAGQLLAELGDEDLRLEQRRWESEVARYQSSYAEAQAKQDRAQLVMADARAAESRAQLDLVEQQIARTRIVAPFDALVIKGDLMQQLGAPVKRGDSLFTLTPSREFRVMLEIDERDVGAITPGTRGAVTLSALPERSIPLVVDRVMPVARTDLGRNVFEAEAHVDGAAATATAAALRPGMQGVARLDAGRRPLIWLASHRLVDWLRLQWWSWVG